MDSLQDEAGRTDGAIRFESHDVRPRKASGGRAVHDRLAVVPPQVLATVAAA